MVIEQNNKSTESKTLNEWNSKNIILCCNILITRQKDHPQFEK